MLFERVLLEKQPLLVEKTGFSYRYGFQACPDKFTLLRGQEKDDEIKGEGNSVNYKYRMHDARVGCFFAIDRLASKYPHNSLQAFSDNRVINAVELEGKEMDELFSLLNPLQNFGWMHLDFLKMMLKAFKKFKKTSQLTIT
jgi:hypothetical protein